MKKPKLNKIVKCMSLLGLSVMCCTLSIAQGAETSDKETESDESNLRVITITAERREVNLQKTSIAASVLDGEDIANMGIVTVDQLQFAMPSVTVNNFGQGIDFNIRGIGKAEHNTQTTTGVITYRDGVGTFPGYYTAEPYYDISRVEVLRGPQGTFAGQNATGGAVFVTTNNPEIGGSYSGYIAGQVGNYSNRGLQGAINIPVSDTFAARVAFNTERRDSFYDIVDPNETTGTDGQPLLSGDDGVSLGSVRLSLLWEPSDSLSVLFKTDHHNLNLSAYPSDPVGSSNDIFDITANAELKARDKFARSILKVDYEFDGGTIFRSVSGYQTGKSIYRSDLDGSSDLFNTFRDDVEETIYSQEFNLISPDSGAFSWILGMYLQNDDIDFLPGEFVVGLPGTGEYILDGTNPKETRAAFGQVSFDLSDRVELQVGLRHSKNETSNDIHIMQYGTPLESVQTEKFSKTTGKVSLNWDLDNDNFLYAFVASGYRPGGLNVNVGLGVPEPFEQEEVTSFELGWKAEWFDDHVRTQLTAFHNNYDNFQVRIGYPDIPVFAFEVNTPETTKITGMEAQVQGVFGDFSINAAVSKLSSEIGEFYATDPRITSVTPCDPLIGPDSASCINLDGRDQTYAPDFTFNINMQYIFEAGLGTLTPRVNFGHISEQWATLFQNEDLGDQIGSRNVLGAQLAWEHEEIIVTLYGTNITDKHYVGAINSGGRFAGPPRQYGLRILKSFF